MRRIAAAVCAAVLASAGTALAQDFFEARNFGMGGAGVASSRYLAAGFYNPALVAHGKANDDFGLLLPAVGLAAFDPEKLADDIDRFQDSYEALEDALEGGIPSTTTLRNDLVASLNAMDGKRVFADLGGGFAIGYPTAGWSFSLVGRNYSRANIDIEIDLGDINNITNPGIIGNPQELEDNINSRAVAVGAAITEVGVVVARRFSMMGIGFSVGIMPKYQRVDTYNYAVSPQSFDEDDDDWRDSKYRNEETGFNVDLGLAAQPLPGLTVGLSVRDLIGDDFDTVLTNGRKYVYDLAPQATLGAAWESDYLTLTADVDAVKAKRFEQDDETQMLRGGLEIDLYHWLQLRGGFRHDLEDNLEDVITAGVGISPFDTLHVDIAGMLGTEENTYGGVVQLRFTF